MTGHTWLLRPWRDRMKGEEGEKGVAGGQASFPCAAPRLPSRLSGGEAVFLLVCIKLAGEAVHVLLAVTPRLQSRELYR